MKQIAVKISDAAHERLQHLAHQAKTNYATIIENALMTYQPFTSETSKPTSEIHLLIDAALQPVLDRLEALESMGLVKPLSPEHGIVVRVESTHQEAHQGVATGQEVIEAVADKIVPENAPGAAVDQIEREAALSSIESNESPARSVKEFIADLIANGERSQTTIARALNDAGYRTGKGTEFQRSNPQIKAALDQVKGE